MTRRWMLACLVLIAAAGSRAGTTQPLRPAEPLFTSPANGAGNQAARAAGRSTDRRSRPSRVAMDRLRDERLLLNLFPDLSLEAERRRDGMLPDGSWLWEGRIAGDPLSAVTFVRAGGLLQGSIRSAAGSFSVEPIGEGPDHLLRQIDTALVPEELIPLVPPRRPAADAQPAVLGDDGSTIDVLVVYTAAARQQAGGSDSAVKARVALGVAETNTAYANSGVLQRLRLVGTELVGYEESGDLSTDLQSLTAESDGLMDIVHARRTAVGADLVTLVVGSTAGGACGVAWVMQQPSVGFSAYGFSVTAYPCISPNYTFGHELGHNMGSAHAPEDPNAPPAFPYSYGYKDPGQAFRTVMAYDCPAGCPRVLHFSNPTVTYAGQPTGTPAQNNNASSLNQTAPLVANFRPSRTDATLLAPPSGLRVETATQGTTVTLSWLPPPSGTPTDYLIEVGTAEGFDDIVTLVVSGAATSLVQEQVPPGSYFIRVRAFDDAGPSAPSNSVHLVMTSLGQCVEPAAAPLLLTPVATGNLVTLSWTRPSAGGAISTYVIGAGTRSGTVDAAVFTVGAVTTYATPAAPGVYFVRVSGANGCGIGTPSNEVSVVVGAPIPGPPTGLSAAISTTGIVSLTWQAPTAGGAPTQYAVEAGSAPGQANLAVIPTGSIAPSFSVLAPPGRYFVRVRAINEYGTSVASEEIVLLVI